MSVTKSKDLRKKLSVCLNDLSGVGAYVDVEIAGITLDSRTVSKDYLFVALVGGADSGEKYIDDAVKNGAVAVLIDSEAKIVSTNNAIVKVKNLKENLASIVTRFYEAPSENLMVVGVTGTNGKSTVVSLVSQLMTRLKNKTGQIGTLGFGDDSRGFKNISMTTPDVASCHRILKEFVDDGYSAVAMEVSSHGIHQKRIENVKFDAVVLTNVTHDHLDYHGSFDNYSRTKKDFILKNRESIVVLNYDDESCKALLQELKPISTSYSFSINNKSADLFFTEINYSVLGVNAKVNSPWGVAKIFSPLVGEFNLANLLAAIAVVCGLGLDFDQVTHHISKLHPVSGRMERVENTCDLNIYIDYAHTPDALENAIKALRLHTQKILWVVFGCGGDRDKTKRALMGKIAFEAADRVMVTSDNPRTESPHEIIEQILSGINSQQVLTEIDREQAIRQVVNQIEIGDSVLIAGKGHEDYQIIGESKYPFSDREIVLSAVMQKHQGATI